MFRDKMQTQDAAKNQRDEQGNKHDELIRERVEHNFSHWARRYTVQDAYTTSELTRAYDRKNSRGRIKLLRRVYRQTACLPYELALKAVTDSAPEVREWMAREGQNLDYRHTKHEGADVLVHAIHADRDLTALLRKDSDPFVRATFFENPELFSPYWDKEWIAAFRECSHLERLAMMRNEALDFDLVKLILDPDDTKLGIEINERFQFAKACLVNKRVVENGWRTKRGYSPVQNARFGWFQSYDYSKTVWELAMKWPDKAGIPYKAFHTIQTFDRVKAAIYSRCEEIPLRGAIIESCLPEDEETLRLARADSDKQLRSMAYWKSRRMDKGEIEAALLREKAEKDNGAMNGLLTNPWLEPTAREILDKLE